MNNCSCYNNYGDYMKIEKIKKLNSGKYKIELDNKENLITYDEVILKNNLLFNKNLDTKTLNKIATDNSYYHIYNKVLNYISKRIRSKKEIINYIDKFETDKKEEIIKDLEKKGFINDKKFASSYAADKINLSNFGPYKIRADLENHNIDSNIISEVIDDLDNKLIIKKLNKLITKKISLDHKHSPYYLKQKIVAELVNLGYPKDLILALYNDNNISNDSLEREYDKIYQKLSRKNTDNLEFKIKQKLYQKGYNLSEIDEIVNKKRG